MTCSAKRLGPKRTGLGLVFTRGILRSIVTPSLLAEFLEILQRQAVDVRRVVPAERQLPRDGGPAGQEQLQPAAPVGEVREADDHLAAHPQQLPKDPLRVLDRLHGLRQDDVVEALVDVAAQAALDVPLDDRDAAADAADHEVLVQLDALALDLPVGRQPGQQLAVAAADVEDPAARLDQRPDQLVIDTGPLGLLEAGEAAAGRSARSESRQGIRSCTTRLVRSPCAGKLDRNAPSVSFSSRKASWP